MNDHQDFHHFLYGRKAEVQCLHKIVKSVLTRRNRICVDEKECGKCSSTNETEESPIERNCNMICGSPETINKGNDCQNGIKNEAIATEPTESSSSNVERAPADAASSTCGTTDCQQHSSDNPCQILLVCGPAGSGKRTFVRAAFQLYGGALYKNPNTSCLTTEANHASKISSSSLSQSHLHTYILASGRFRQSPQSTESSSVVTTSNLREENNKQLAAFDDVFREIYDVLKSDSIVLEKIRRKLLRVLESPDSDLRLLLESFPCLQPWLQLDSAKIQQQNDESAKSPYPVGITSYIPASTRRMHVIKQQTQVLCRILTQFIQVVSSVTPVIFILEDLQNADAASLMLIEELLAWSETYGGLDAQSRSMGLLLVATYTLDAKLGKSDALISFLKRYRSSCENCVLVAAEDVLSNPKRTVESVAKTEWSLSSKTSILHGPRICITEYSWEDVHQWIQECRGNIQKCTIAQKRDLTNLVFHNTNGNPIRIRYLLIFLENDDTILIDDINKKRIPKNMEDMITSIFGQLDTSIQYMLKTAAALAHVGLKDIDCDILEVSVGQPCMENILIAQGCGMLEYVPAGRYVKFYCQEIEGAVYSQITFLERSAFHLETGRRIWRNASLDETKEGKNSLEIIGSVVLATFQFRCISNLLTDIDECLYMAKSCYELGKEALYYKDFDTAAKLFDFSIYVLGPNLWRDDLYETSLVLHNSAAQAYCYMGEFTCLQRILDAIFDNAISFRDKLPAFVTLVYFQGSGHQLREAFRTASATLKELGEPINQNSGDFNVVFSLIKTKYKLMGKSIDYLVNLPIVENETDLIVAQLLCFASIYSYVVKPESSVVLGFRLIRLAIDRGVSGPSAVAFSTYGFVLCAMGNFKEGYRYGEVALKLANKFEVWRPRVYTFVYGYVNQWSKPIRDCIAPLQDAAQSAIIGGDLEIYAGSTFFLNMCSFFSGTSLCTLEPLVQSHCQSIALYGQLNPLMSMVPHWSFLKDLTCNEELLNLPGDITDAETAFKYAVKEGNKYVVGGVYVFRTMWYYLIGDYKVALEMAKKSVEQRKLSDYGLTLYEGLAAVALASTMQSHSRRRYRKLGRVMARRIKNWAQRCPDNFLNKQLLLEAEIAGLNGNSKSAISLFQKSIDKAVDEGFVHEEGIAYECLGRYQFHLGRQSDACISFTNARNAFDKWGAIRLVRRMDQILVTMN